MGRLRAISSRKWVLTGFTALLLLNLGVGLAAFLSLRRLDRDYSRLLNQGIPFLNAMQTATANASRSYALLAEMALASSADERMKLREQFLLFRLRNDSLFSGPGAARAVPSELRPEFEAILARRQLNRPKVDRYLSLLDQNQASQAESIFRTEVYAGYKDYLEKLDQFCNAYEAAYGTLNQNLSAQAEQRRTILFGIAATPFFAAAGVVMVALSVVAVMLALYPRSGHLDA